MSSRLIISLINILIRVNFQDKVDIIGFIKSFLIRAIVDNSRANQSSGNLNPAFSLPLFAWVNLMALLIDQ
jgi:hypothetical protein